MTCSRVTSTCSPVPDLGKDHELASTGWSLEAGGRREEDCASRGNLEHISAQWVAFILLAVCSMGCATIRPKMAQPESQNIVFVPVQNEEQVWEEVVDILHDYFQIARENRLDGLIETHPCVGSSLMEPWKRDSVGLKNRLESTLQSVRRRAFVNVIRTDGGYIVGIEVNKEREDVLETSSNSAGVATFQDAKPLSRDLSLVAGRTQETGWLELGRDYELEQTILSRIEARFRK